MEEITKTPELFNTALIDVPAISQLLLRFLFNAIFVGIIIHVFYYRKSRNINFYFTFSLISICVFFLIYLLGMGGIKIKMGMALGLFAIFGILRYRTEVISVREMTYIFVIITISVINALSVRLSYSELLVANLIFILAVWFFESCRKIKRVACKHILYDRLDNVRPEQYKQLVEEVRERTGLDVVNIEVGAINYLHDTVMLKVYYKLRDAEVNTVDSMLKLPKND